MFDLKTLLKALMYPMLAIIIIGITIEFVNVNINSIFVKQIITKTIQLSADYFNQETYKTDSVNSGDMSSLIGEDGAEVSGQFYVGTTPEEVYNSLYRNSGEFNQYISQFGDTWKDLKTITHSGENDLVDANLVTPLNMGITYLDKETVSRIVRWQLAAIMMNNKPSLLRTDTDNGKEYVLFNGFRLYVNDFQIRNITYNKVRVDSSEFTAITHMNANNLGLVDDTGANVDDERMNIVVANIEYVLPMTYEGITYLGNLIEYMVDRTIDSSTTGVQGTGDYAENIVNNNIGLNLVPSDLVGGTSSTSVGATTGVIKYYIVR